MQGLVVVVGKRGLHQTSSTLYARRLLIVLIAVKAVMMTIKTTTTMRKMTMTMTMRMTRLTRAMVTLKCRIH